LRPLLGRYFLIFLIGLLFVPIPLVLIGLAHPAEPLNDPRQSLSIHSVSEAPTPVISLAPSITEMIARDRIAPHAVRQVLSAVHRVLFPASAFVGGMFQLLADTAALTLLSAREISAGIITALTGGPSFIYLMMRKK
jgi:hypothetical protein